MASSNPVNATIAAPSEPLINERWPAIPGYEVLELLGNGGMGRVYRARHLDLDRIVAVKLMSNGAETEMGARFKQEIQAVATLRHPYIAQIFEAGAADGLPYFAMEYVPGGSLAQLGAVFYECLTGRPPFIGPARVIRD